MKSPRVLIVEDEQALATALATVCRRLNATPTTCFSAAQARTAFEREPFPLVILDIGLPDANGLDLLPALDSAKVLVITAHGNLDNAIAARQRGAVEYLVKPLDLAELEATLKHLLMVDTSRPREHSTPRGSEDDTTGLLVGGAPAMQPVFMGIANATLSDAPVLMTGPTGVGKGLAARVIHRSSRRAAAPFVALHCAAFPEQLLEAELFGHEKNAFTGATSARPGHIERAAGGTLFLDEIGDISPAVQAKLMRFVEEKTFTRLGGREDLVIDLRLMAATHRDLRAEVHAGRFREDLYYRLKVLEIALPALADRPEDLPALSAYFLGALAQGRRVRLGEETLQLLRRYPWPGNVRQLRNALEHALAVCATDIIQPQHLPAEIRHHAADDVATGDALDAALAAWLRTQLNRGLPYDQIHAGLERRVLRELLRHFDGKPSVLARELSINRVTLLKKRRQLGL